MCLPSPGRPEEAVDEGVLLGAVDAAQPPPQPLALRPGHGPAPSPADSDVGVLMVGVVQDLVAGTLELTPTTLTPCSWKKGLHEMRNYIKLRKILHFFLKDMTLQGKNFATTGREKYQVCYNIE